MSAERRYKKIDEIEVSVNELTSYIEKYHQLDYAISVSPQFVKTLGGYYKTEYTLKVYKIEGVEE